MYVTQLVLERFGHYSNLRIDGLTEGLNIVCGPSRSGKTTILHFLRAMFGGFNADLRPSYLVPGQGSCGGAITVQSPEGRQTISRYDDGCVEGRLSVERADGAVIGRRNLDDLLAGVTSRLIDQALIVDFRHRPELHDLLAAAHEAELPLRAEPPQPDRLRLLELEIAEGEQHVSALRRELDTVDRTLTELNRRLHSSLAPVQRSDGSLIAEKDGLELQAMDAQLRRWRRTLRDIVGRKQRAAEKAELCSLEASHALTDCQRTLRSLETNLQSLGRAVNQVADRQLVHRPPAVADMQERLQLASHDLHEMHRVIIRWQDQDDIRQAAEERDQLGRCEVELRLAIRRLVERRQALAERLSQVLPSMTPPITHEVNDGAEDNPVEHLKHEVQRLADVRLKWLAEVDEWQAEIELRRQERERLTQVRTALVDVASEYLTRLSSGDWRRIHLLDKDEVWLENEAGERVPHSDLHTGARDQVYLAFCLACHAAVVQRGAKVPLVMNAAFTHYPSKNIRDALELLRDVAKGRQILCLTRHEHVVSVARLMNILVHNLDGGESVDAAVTGPVGGPSEPEFQLDEHAPIDGAPSMDETNARRLRQIGVCRVGDLLRLAPALIANELRDQGISAEMVDAWQCQARLMCRLPGLRAYDARILVACGVRDPEQLRQIQAGALRARVKEFASSAEGQAILMSGTEDDLSRVTEWIKAARAATTPATNSVLEPDTKRAKRTRRRRAA